MVLQSDIQALESASKEIKTIWKCREEALIERLGFFQPECVENTQTWFLDDIRYWGIKACHSFIQLTPYLHHTPASLRALFSVPTRSHRKKGKHSSKSLRNTAEKLGLSPDWEIIVNLISFIENNDELPSKYKKILLRRLNEIKSRSIHPYFIESEPDHSDESLDRLKEILKSMFPNLEETNSIPTFESELTPDLVFYTNQNQIYVELKEWGSEFVLLFKPFLQVLSYSLETNAVIFVLSGYPPTLFDKINGLKSGNALSKELEPMFLEAKSRKRSNEKIRSDLINSLKKVEPYALRIQEKCALLTIIEELSGEELGISSMEYSCSRKIQLILQEITKLVNIHHVNIETSNILDIDKIIENKNLNIIVLKGFS